MSRHLDDRDSAVFLMYALLVREVQWFEVCLGGVVEAQTTDLRTPVEERLPEIERQLRLTPSQIARKLQARGPHAPPPQTTSTPPPVRPHVAPSLRA